MHPLGRPPQAPLIMKNYPPAIQKIIEKHIGSHTDQLGRMTYFYQYSLSEFVQELVYAATEFGFENGINYVSKGSQDE